MESKTEITNSGAWFGVDAGACGEQMIIDILFLFEKRATKITEREIEY